MNKFALVAGGAGFVGVNLCSRLLDDGYKVAVIDNFCRGSLTYLEQIRFANQIIVIEADLTKRDACEDAFREISKIGDLTEVWHLAANSDIPAGVADSDVDLKDTFLTTHELLRCMRSYNVPSLYFASSSAIYGDHGSNQLHESIGPVLPISNYGAMKLASEGLISAAVESYLQRACLFRFPNVVGTPATHGVILDFIRKLKDNGSELQVLGDGSQQKAYLHVSDLIDAMLYVSRQPNLSKLYPINIGPIDEGVFVRWIAEKVVARVSPSASMVFGEGSKGWVGDVPKFHYSVRRLLDLGWAPSMDSAAAVIRAINEIALQEDHLSAL